MAQTTINNLPYISSSSNTVLPSTRFNGLPSSPRNNKTFCSRPTYLSYANIESTEKYVAFGT